MEVDFFFKFLIILAKSFENWPIFPWKTEVDFLLNFQCFQGIVTKSLENLTFFGQFFKIFPKNPQFFSKFSRFHALCSKISLFSLKKRNRKLIFFSKFLKLFRYRGKDVVKSGSENGKIENLQGFKRFVAKSLKI